ncbi:MAG TPA: hypothetical protein PLM07_09855 [Candidatus Rifleibacterium sp.]|nr:hypothetical protein [Candidatus Rifleibacterium sp.]HPT46191.1 hypothetical protein [Candidatus Rifleibacterium sp.]
MTRENENQNENQNQNYNQNESPGHNQDQNSQFGDDVKAKFIFFFVAIGALVVVKVLGIF